MRQDALEVPGLSGRENRALELFLRGQPIETVGKELQRTPDQVAEMLRRARKVGPAWVAQRMEERLGRTRPMGEK